MGKQTAVLVDIDAVRSFVTYSSSKQLVIKPLDGNEGVSLIKLTIIDNSSPRRENAYYMRIEVKAIEREEPVEIIPTEV